MKSIRKLIMSGIAVIAITVVPCVFATSQAFVTTGGPNSGKNETFYLTVPAVCNISSSVVFTNPNQPSGGGGGGGGVSVTLINIQTVYSFGYSGNMSGSDSRSATGQAAGSYQINHYSSAGGTGAYTTTTTTFTW